MKRSHEPVFWLLFGAGGMLSALVGPVLVFITGIAVPLGWLAPDALDHARVLAFVRHPLGALAVWAVVSLFLFQVAMMGKAFMGNRMEANRLLREIKRVELQVALLRDQIGRAQ